MTEQSVDEILAAINDAQSIVDECEEEIERLREKMWDIEEEIDDWESDRDTNKERLTLLQDALSKKIRDEELDILNISRDLTDELQLTFL